MSQSILRNEDFKTGTLFNNVRGLTYKSSGSPVNRISAANAGAIYIDDLTGQLWLATASGEPATWRPYFAEVVNSIRIDSDVQEGDLIGIFGLGTWTTSGNLNLAKTLLAAAGSQNATFATGGLIVASSNTTELFNGSIWSTSSVLSISKNGLNAAGSQNAGLVAGGTTTSAKTNLTELFNGSSWSASGVLSAAKYLASSAGTQNASFYAGGDSSPLTSVTELFNGATWSAGSALSIAKSQLGGFGAQNAGLITGGLTVGSNVTNASELFNGSAWAMSAVLSIAKYQITGGGTQNSALVAGGSTAGANTNATELFNGSSWSASGTLAIATRASGGSGSQAGGLMAGGTTNAVTRTTRLHTQSIYRKLTYNSAQCALNVGMAYNVTTTSLTASVIRGDLPSTYIPGNALSTTYSNSVWFGISRHNNVDNNVYISSATATISSISTSVANQATLNLSVAITSGFAVGSLLLISNGTKVPIIGGTELRPLVKWENVSNSATSTLTVACLWGQRIKYNSVNITSSSTQATVTQVSNVQLTTFYKGRVGDTLLIPYASVSGTNGSALYAGSYLIQDVSYPTASTIAYLINLPFTANNITETAVGGVTLLQQIVCKAGAFSVDDVVLGYRNKMRNPMNPIYDDMSNGLI